MFLMLYWIVLFTYESMKRYVKPNKITAHLHSPAEAVQPCRLAR